MTSITNAAGNVPLDGNDDVSLATLVALVADEPVRAGSSTVLTNEYTPTEGRVAILADDTVYVGDGSAWIPAADIALAIDETARSPQDVRAISNPTAGDESYHDGSGTNTEGPAFYNGSDWISTVDGSTIA
ncbi:MAG: hypothetical protein V5A34_05635 [Halapricum sp.]